MPDQLSDDEGNPWVWPGTHLAHADYFREHGPDVFFEAAGHPPITLPEPERIHGRAGDVLLAHYLLGHYLLAHYLLGHDIGGNTSDVVHRALYFRVVRSRHDPRRREFLQDPWLDYDPVRLLAG